MEKNIIYNMDCLEGLKTLGGNTVDCCVTSPPYFGLRNYGTASWKGGNPDCKHFVKCDGYAAGKKQQTNSGSLRTAKDVCLSCGAQRIDEQIGLEETPEAYLERLAAVFMEVHRILKPDGTLWLNIGDSYAGSGHGYLSEIKGKQATSRGTEFLINRPPATVPEGLKAKDLIGIPWTLALELRRRGWYLRQDIIWHKPNPMPESIKDRCTKSHEYIFLLAKSASYYFDNKAILEPAAYDGRKDTINKGISHKYLENSNYANGYENPKERWPNRMEGQPARNKRSVWSVCTQSEKDAHFATFPKKLIIPCILAGCPENGIVLDPFMGSGTTAAVARKLNRNYIGFELNSEYVKMAGRKLNRELGLFQ
jgi:DNA modification methylase